MARRRNRAGRLVGRDASWHKQDPVQGQLVARFFGGEKMAVVDGVKGATENAQPPD
jgi:hypothetical protein